MGTVLLQWCYIAVTAFVTGFFTLRLLTKKSGYQGWDAVSCMLAGLLVQNVYAQYFSLFAGVGLWANVWMAAFVGAVTVGQGRKMAAFLGGQKRRAGRRRLLAWGLLALLFAYGSSRGYMHYDTGLYHAQSIRWIEEYGVVPGLANLHSRFGYNSAAFALCALFGGAGLSGYPIHGVQGFFALLCAVKCMPLFSLPKRKQVRLSDFLYIGCIFYLVAVFRELVAPASDYFAMLLLFLVLMRWVELLESGEKESLPYALLSLCLVYAATVKLSAAALLALALWPAWQLVTKRKWGQIAGYLALGAGIAFPYLARNVLISGWLFYPFTFLDIFPVDWKIAKGYADSDAAEIQVYAKEIFDVYQKNKPFSEWFPNWLMAQGLLDRLLVVWGWVSVFAGIGEITIGAVKKERKTAGMDTGAFLVLEATAVLGFLVWQFGAPLVRYGYFYVLFLPLVTFGAVYVQFWARGKGFWGFLVILVAFLLYRGYNLCNMVLEFCGQPYYWHQQDYGTYPAETYEVDGVTVYVPTDRGQIGYDKFPSSPIVQDIELRGDTLRFGFRKKTG